ncbi:endonuclease [Leptobacterium flavescens]|uniref:Endonuclease n=1 Tax=Leptobacterium flavescens TaxID=472055 RepID=A0A6P0UIT7_9FLAO|nr:endonuclease/exonuclease/phosphatase family protein [Leptobacterium flavescens]NER13144.1 endonuclease [Leptobacterium flavescens]
MSSSSSASHKIGSLHTVAFYNLENLFDTKNDSKTLDDDFTPKGFKKWNKKRYHGKLRKLSKAISNVGRDKNGNAPVIVGLAEVENKGVIKDLIGTKHLRKKGFGYVHYDSPDERGIDVALIYQEEYFTIIHSEVIPLMVYNEEGQRDFTRDILYVNGRLNNETVHILVNHWPSRRSGSDETSYKRVEAAKTVRHALDRIKGEEEDPVFIIMGDFNDDPGSESIKDHLMGPDLYNPMSRLLSIERGSLNHRFHWNLFDQIIFSHNFFDHKAGTHKFAHADIFDDHFLKEWKGKYKNNPFRTFKGRKYLGGYSDHFPVYIQLKMQ